MRTKRAIDLEIAALADVQHGVVARRQLTTLGVTKSTISRRTGAGRLRPLHRGVYAVGHAALTIEGRWLAAVLACGDDAVLSHASAAAAWELQLVGSGPVHVTVRGDPGRKRRDGIRVHRSTTITLADTTTHRRIPITTPVRTLVDLATTLTGRPLEQALDRAERTRCVDFSDLHAAIEAHPTRPGSPALRALLSRYAAGSTLTRSELEEAFLRLCDAHGIPRPASNARVEGMEVDFVWREARLIVEVDGYAYHRSPTAFEADRERDVVLRLAGWQVLRFTYEHVTGRAGWVAAAVRDCLAP